MGFGKNKFGLLVYLTVLLISTQQAFAQNISIAATVDPSNKIVETDEANNSEVISQTLVETTPLHAVFTPVDFYNDNDFVTSVRDISSFVKATYPASDKSFFVTSNPGTYQTNDVGVQLTAMNLRVQQNLTFSPYPTEIFAIIPNGWLSGNAVGLANPTFGVFFVEPWFTDSNNELVYMPSNGAHELGHSYDYGLCDEYSYCSWLAENLLYLPNNGGCGNSFPFVCPYPIAECAKCYSNGSTDITGFWVEKKKEISPYSKNFFYDNFAQAEEMAKQEGKKGADCSITIIGSQFEVSCRYNFYSIMGNAQYPNFRWVTKQTYERLLFKSEAAFSLPFSSLPSKNQFSSFQSLLLSGLVDKNGWVGLEDFYVLDRVAEGEIPDGDYSLKLLDAGGNVLFDQNFGVSFTLLSDPPIDLNTTAFVFTVPFPEGTSKIRVDFNGITRAERLVSANAPEACFISPVQGDGWSSVHTVEWATSDSDGDSVSSVLQYSSDKGLTWNPLAIDLNRTTFDFDARHFDPGGNYMLKVIVTDGVLTGEAVSGIFSIKNPDIDIQPWSFDFGEVEQGTIVSTSFDLANNGNEVLEVSGAILPQNAVVSGPRFPLLLMQGDYAKFRLDFNTAGLDGLVDANIVFVSNDPNEGQKLFFIVGSVLAPETMDGNLHLSDMNSYEKEHNPYSGAASAKMILDYIREAAGYPKLSQDTLYNYGHQFNMPENSLLLDMDANAMDSVLGHFDPYDAIVSNSYDLFDLLAGGNAFQGYNFSVDAYDANSGPDVINRYMNGIVHWMAWPVPREQWWLKGELVAEPYTPAAIPVYGSYSNWVVVNGFSASGNPVPLPYTNPWYGAPITIYGFWLTDPAADGIGHHVYVTADDANAVYFQPMNTGDAYDGKFIQIAEPPALPPEDLLQEIDLEDSGSLEIACPVPDAGSLEYIGVLEKENKGEEESKIRPSSLAISQAQGTMPPVLPLPKKSSWRDLVDAHMLSDEEAISAFDGAEMGEPVFVHGLGEEKDYYLVPFSRQGLASGVIMLDAEDGHFRQASWSKEPVEYLPLTRGDAVSMVKDILNPNYVFELSIEFGSFGEAKAELAWAAGDCGKSPFEPFWDVELDGGRWLVAQDGQICGILPPDSKFNALIIEKPGSPPNSTGFSALEWYYEVVSEEENGSFSATMTFRYNDIDNDGFVDGTEIREEELEIYYYDETAGWIIAGTPERDIANNSISVTVNHFTLFALMSEAAESEPTVASAIEPVDERKVNPSSGGGGGILPKVKKGQRDDSKGLEGLPEPKEAQKPTVSHEPVKQQPANPSNTDTEGILSPPDVGFIPMARGIPPALVFIGSFAILVFIAGLFLFRRMQR